MMSRDRVYALTASGAVVLSAIAGFLMLGSPDRQRSIRADERRVQDLQLIANVLHSRVDQLPPASLSEVGMRSKDPVTGKAYEYQRLEGSAYRLCAEFTGESPDDRSTPVRWRHRAGRQCFDLNAKVLP